MELRFFWWFLKNDNMNFKFGKCRSQRRKCLSLLLWQVTHSLNCIIFRLIGSNISSMRQCFVTRWNTEKRVENTRCSGIFLMNFEVFRQVMKHCVESLILLLKQNDFRRRNLGCKNEQFFIWFPNTYKTLISFVFSLWIIEEFEKCCQKTQSHTDQLHVDML